MRPHGGERVRRHRRADYLKEAEQVLTVGAFASNLLGRECPRRRFRFTFSTTGSAVGIRQLSVTQQPQFNFGQSWPAGLHSMSAFLDSTQRWQLMGGIKPG